MSAGRVLRCPRAEQSVGWALRALEPAEELDAAAHLPTCESCRELVGQAEELLAALGSTSALLEPPPELRGRLLARVAETAQQPPLPLGEPAPRSEQAEPDPDPERRHAPHDPSMHPRRWRIALVAAGVSAALAVGALAVATAQPEQLHGEQSSQAQQLARMVSQLQQPGAKLAVLFPAGGTPVAAVLVSDGAGKVITLGLPPNDPAASTYVLWATGSDAPRALGTFDITTADNGLHSLGLVKDPDTITGYAISVEPGRTPPTSPSLTVASGRVQS